MPTNPEKDPQCNKKKRHIGNDFVTIVYDNAGHGQSYKLVCAFLIKQNKSSFCFDFILRKGVRVARFYD
jgi:hypothetical protein